MKINSFLIIIGAFGITACDPYHELYLENKTTENITIQTKRNGTTDVLNSGSSIVIGQCVARYEPTVSDIEFDYLRIINKSDTITLSGKSAIFSMLQKVEKLNWRIIIRDK